MRLLRDEAASGAADQPHPTVKVVHAQYRTVKRTVEQPGVISAYERTALYAKVSGFVRKWNVDIGDRVKKGATLVELTAPELVAQHRQMQAQVDAGPGAGEAVQEAACCRPAQCHGSHRAGRPGTRLR